MSTASTKKSILAILFVWALVACGTPTQVAPPVTGAPPLPTTALPVLPAVVPATAVPRNTLPPPVSAPSSTPDGANKPPAELNNAAVASGIQLPAGFRAYVYVDGLSNPTSLLFGPDGRLYVAEQSGRISSFAMQNGQGVDAREVARVGGGATLGIAFRPNTHDLYISNTHRVYLARGAADGSFSEPKIIVDNLPTGRHQNDEIAFTQDGQFFFLGVGSTCDVCQERDPRSASIMRISADGAQQDVYAHGVRNPFGLAIHPRTGELFATDNGRDVPLTGVPDELNVIVKDGKYGWPDCWGNGKGTNCAGTMPPVVELQEHSSADGFAFYMGTGFPAEYRENVFIAEWGGNAPLPTIGKRVERIILTQTNGQWQGRASVFASGFDHPIAVAVGPQDGALYIADHGSGTIYRILFAGP